MAASFLKALAHADRLLLLCLLLEEELSVGALGQRAGVGQPALSQQLAVLRRERLVETRREGKHVVYSVSTPAVAGVLKALHEHFCGPGASTPRAKQRTRKAGA